MAERDWADDWAARIGAKIISYPFQGEAVRIEIAAALRQAKADALEEAARWHDKRAARFRGQGNLRADGIARSHTNSAAAIRALKPAQGGDR